MTITLEIQPEIERGLLARAQARGISMTAFVEEIVAREAHLGTGQELIDVCARVRGLADDLDISRNPSSGRAVDLS